MRVLWNSCQLLLLSLVTRCPAWLQSLTLFLGLLVSLFCTGCPELLSASCGAGRGESFIAPRPSKRGKEITWMRTLSVQALRLCLTSSNPEVALVLWRSLTDKAPIGQERLHTDQPS